MIRKGLLVFCVFMAHVWTSGAAYLRYDEGRERVLILESETVQAAFQYSEAMSGFVDTKGNWVAWDNEAGNWLSIYENGLVRRFSMEGKMILEQRLETGASKVKPEKNEYNPLDDVGDSSGGKSVDLDKAWNYHKKRHDVITNAVGRVSGEDGGSAIATVSLGGDRVGKEKNQREAWQKTKGEHQGNPAAAMDTGEVTDPIKALAKTIQSAYGMVRGINSTIDSVEQMDDVFDNFGGVDTSSAPGRLRNNYGRPPPLFGGQTGPASTATGAPALSTRTPQAGRGLGPIGGDAGLSDANSDLSNNQEMQEVP